MFKKFRTKLLTKLTRKRSDIQHIIESVKTRQIISRSETKIILQTLRAHATTVEQVMTDKAHTIAVKDSDNVDHIFKIYQQHKHSRYPVNDKDGNIIGMILIKDLLTHVKENPNDYLLSSIIRPAYFTTESQSILTLLTELQQQHKHMAIVLDEYAQFTGIATIENILEQLVGQIEDEHDAEHPEYILEKGPNTHIVNGATPIEQFNQTFQSNIDATEFDTIAGILSKQFGHIPKPGEKIEIDGLSFIIIKATPAVIQRIEVTKLSNQ